VEPAQGSPVLLLVEDDVDYAGLIRLTCDAGDLDLRVVHVTTAAEAMLRLALGDVRCVLLDLSLPDVRGLEGLNLLREVDPEVPVVVLTGVDSDLVGVAALQAGAQDFLVKGQHPPDAVTRSVLFALERADRQAAQRRQVQLDDRLQLREAQLSEAQRLARIGSWEWDLLTGEVLWSEELKRLTGLDHVAGDSAFAGYLALVAEEDRPQAARLFSLEAAEDPPVVVRHRLVRRDGTRRWVQGHMTAAGWGADGEPVRIIGTMQDVTEQKLAEDLLAHQALHDSLTGLVKREVLLDRLARVLAEPQPDGSLVAVVFLDLDRFKWVNDSRSHAVGDRLLVTVARALERALRPDRHARPLRRGRVRRAVRTGAGRGGRAAHRPPPRRCGGGARRPARPGPRGVQVTGQPGASRPPSTARRSRPRRSCGTRTSPCTGARSAAAPASRSSTRACASGRPLGCRRRAS
jgi:PAS domain S-box-containing protein